MMSASDDTISKVARVILRHVDREVAVKIATELLEVPGNKSFRETVERLAKLLSREPRR